MAILGKGGYDSPENKKRREKKEFLEKEEKEQRRRKKSAKEKDRLLVKDVKSVKDVTKGGKDFLKDLSQGAKNVGKNIRQAVAPTPEEKKQIAEMKRLHMKRVKERNIKDRAERIKREKAIRAGAPDSEGKYVYDAVLRDRQDKIKPKNLKKTLSDKKVAQVMKDQVDAMKKQDAKRGAKETKEEGIGSFKVGGLILDRNYLKGK
tara:strand:- start:168 stop:782 length:615 start_codon:yes stop_codon:yes gene_type:complete